MRPVSVFVPLIDQRMHLTVFIQLANALETVPSLEVKVVDYKYK